MEYPGHGKYPAPGGWDDGGGGEGDGEGGWGSGGGGGQEYWLASCTGIWPALILVTGSCLLLWKDWKPGWWSRPSTAAALLQKKLFAKDLHDQPTNGPPRSRQVPRVSQWSWFEIFKTVQVTSWLLPSTFKQRNKDFLGCGLVLTNVWVKLLEIVKDYPNEINETG